MRKDSINPMKSTFLPKTCLRLGTCLLLSFLFLLGTLLILGGFGKKIGVVWADDEPVVFTDVTELAGVDLIAPQWGAVWGDYNGDGYQDLYVGNHFDTPNLYRNNGDGTFTDVRESAGLKPGPGDWHGPAWGDYNNDGHLDLYVVTGRAIVEGSDFYVNNGDGTFTERAVAAGVTNDDGRGRNPRWVDYDKDGDLDIFIANAARDIAPDVLYRNNGAGTFTDVAVQAGVATSEGNGSSGAVWADYDGDGHTDFVLTMIGNPIKLYRNQGDGTFVDTADSAGLRNLWLGSAACGDYDNDGDLDLYLGRSYDDYQDKLVWNTKTITAIVRTPYGGGEEGLVFTTTVPTVTFDLWQTDRRHYPHEIEFGSANQHPPAVPFTLDNTTSHIGQPSYTPGVDYGVFIWRDSVTGPWNIRWSGDNERLLGVMTTVGDFTQVISVGLDSPSQPSRPNLLYRNRGDGTFERVVTAGVGDDLNAHNVQWIDFDNDGDLDLFVTNFGDTYFGNQPNRLYRNNGDGTFTDVAADVGLSGLNDGNDECSAWADYDNDGFLDFYLGNSTYTGYLAGPHKLYRNGGNSNHWLQIKLTGTSSNRLGIGAKIQVTAGGLTQFREVGVSSSDSCHNSLLAHFGLGSYTQTEAITVTWPSGCVQVLHNVLADQILNITEGLEAADLSMTKARIGTGNVMAGEPITYTFILTNAGPTSPVTATIVDTFSDPAALAGVNGPGCAWSPGSALVTCTVTDVAVNPPAHLTLVVTTSNTYRGTLTNTATVAPTSDIIDPNPSTNSTAPVTVKVMGGGENSIYMPAILKEAGIAVQLGAGDRDSPIVLWDKNGQGK